MIVPKRLHLYSQFRVLAFFFVGAARGRGA